MEVQCCHEKEAKIRLLDTLRVTMNRKLKGQRTSSRLRDLTEREVQRICLFLDDNDKCLKWLEDNRPMTWNTAITSRRCSTPNICLARKAEARVAKLAGRKRTFTESNQNDVQGSFLHGLPKDRLDSKHESKEKEKLLVKIPGAIITCESPQETAKWLMTVFHHMNTTLKTPSNIDPNSIPACGITMNQPVLTGDRPAEIFKDPSQCTIM